MSLICATCPGARVKTRPAPRSAAAPGAAPHSEALRQFLPRSHALAAPTTASTASRYTSSSPRAAIASPIPSRHPPRRVPYATSANASATPVTTRNGPHAARLGRSSPRCFGPTSHASRRPSGSAGEIGTRPRWPSETCVHAVQMSTTTVASATATTTPLNGRRVQRDHTHTRYTRGAGGTAGSTAPVVGI